MFSSSSRCISSLVYLFVVSCIGFHIKCTENLLNEVEHNCFWYHIDHGSLHDVIVRIDEKFSRKLVVTLPWAEQ
jgi:hypothetical protein